MFAKFTAAALVAALWLSLSAAVRGQDYAKAAAFAVEHQKPLVVFLQCPARARSSALESALKCEADSLSGYHGPAIIVSVPRGTWLDWLCTLPATATDAEIAAALSGMPAGATDAMDELNAQRVRRGLFPFIRDHGLTLAAARCAQHRAARLMAGHTASDFAFLPEGASADCAGCAAWEVGLVTTTGETFGACASDSVSHRYAGAAWVLGADGRRYSHAFYR